MDKVKTKEVKVGQVGGDRLGSNPFVSWSLISRVSWRLFVNVSRLFCFSKVRLIISTVCNKWHSTQDRMVSHST